MFKLNRLGLFPSLLTSVNILGAEKLLTRSRKCDSVQFLFYRAVYEFHGQKFKEAWDRFNETWNLLHVEDWKHRKRVAVYLITIGLCHGKFPSNNFLKKYNLFDEFSVLRDTIQSGNYSTFKIELNARATTLHSLNVYLFFLINVQSAIQLNLIKRSWKLIGKGPILTFEQIKKVAEWYKLTDFPLTSDDELECQVINLIGKGWIKGHLDHERKCLIIEQREDSFPRIL